MSSIGSMCLKSSRGYDELNEITIKDFLITKSSYLKYHKPRKPVNLVNQ
jgi:hypothetical protein